MRYSASEKLEIIRTVEDSSLGIGRTLAQIGIPRSTFYRWCDAYQIAGVDGLEDSMPAPRAVWNRVLGLWFLVRYNEVTLHYERV